MDVKEVPPLKLKERRVLRGHTAKIYSLAWARDSTHLLSASQDGKLIVGLLFLIQILNKFKFSNRNHIHDCELYRFGIQLKISKCMLYH